MYPLFRLCYATQAVGVIYVTRASVEYVKSAAHPPRPIPVEPAGIGRRLAALILDWVASLLLVRLIFSGLEFPGNESAAATLGVFFVEVTAFTWLMGSSFGQRIMGVAVVSDRGGRMSLWRIMVRTALLCLVIPAVVFDSRGRGLHDKAADSIAVLRSSVVAPKP
jgi:uncharacterized RDD family membrane protein YckC